MVGSAQMHPYATASPKTARYYFPARCCCCLSHTQGTTGIGAQTREVRGGAAMVRTSTLQVPFCPSCQAQLNRINRGARIVGVVVLVLPVSLGAGYQVLGSTEGSDTWVRALLAGGCTIIVGLVTLGLAEGARRIFQGLAAAFMPRLQPPPGMTKANYIQTLVRPARLDGTQVRFTNQQYEKLR